MNLQRIPHSIEAEKAVLSCLIIDVTKSLSELHKNGFDKEWFHNPTYRMIYETIIQMVDGKCPVDLISLTERMAFDKVLEDVGGAATLSELYSFLPTAVNITYYIDILRERAATRFAIHECGELIEKLEGISSIKETEELLNKSFQKVRLVCKNPADELTDKQLLEDYLLKMERIVSGEQKIEFIRTPIPTINLRNVGAFPGEVTLISAPPNSGKSILALNFAEICAMEYGHETAIYTMEMPYDQYMNRLICKVGGISSKSIKQAKFTREESTKFLPTIGRIKNSPLHIYDQKRVSMTFPSIEAHIRRLAANAGLRCVVIDYLQLIKITRRNGVRKDEELGFITSGLKSLAIELNLWIYLICAEGKEGGARESYAIEYDVDNWISILCNKQTKLVEKLFIPKWRDGEKGYSIDVELEGEYCRFVDKQTARVG